MSQKAVMESGGSFLRNAGRWAGERFLSALKAGRPLTAQELRTADTLRKDEWIHFDKAVMEEVPIRLVAWGDVVARGLTIPVANSMGKTMYEYDKVTDMNPATMSLDGVTRSDNDGIEFELAGLPLPITHKDFWLHLRHLAASRNGGEPLDTMQARTAARLIAELLERTLLMGAMMPDGVTPRMYGGRPIWGYMSHPDRNLVPFGTGGPWGGTKTGEQILDDILRAITALQADRMYGPYWVYVPTAAGIYIENDFKQFSDRSIRARLEEVEGILGVTTVDQLPAGNILVVQATRDVVAIVQGEGMQTIQWDVEGGMVLNFKVMTIAVPLVRSDIEGRSGIAQIYTP